jgi:hypothetical protein
MKTKKPNYAGFMEHLWAYDQAGIPWGRKDLVRLAKKYHTPIPTRKKDGTYDFTKCITL